MKNKYLAKLWKIAPFLVVFLLCLGIFSFVESRKVGFYVIAYPSDASIMIDGSKFVNGSKLRAGKHQVTIMRSGFASFDSEVKIDGNNKSLLVDLEPESGDVEFYRMSDLRNYEMIRPDSDLVKKARELLLLGDYLPYKESVCGDSDCSAESIREIELKLLDDTQGCSRFVCVGINSFENRAWAESVLADFGFKLSDYELIEK